MYIDSFHKTISNKHIIANLQVTDVINAIRFKFGAFNWLRGARQWQHKFEGIYFI